METGTVLGGAGLFISILGVIYSAINHKHIRSKCCGKVYEVSIDIDPTESAKKAQAEAEQAEAQRAERDRRDEMAQRAERDERAERAEKGIPQNEIIHK
jgi:hypothetical protein